jgi:hypothetical protein
VPLQPIDSPRERPAPPVVRGHDVAGVPVTVDLGRPHIVVAVKPSCDGCRSVLDADLSGVTGLPVTFLAAAADPEWADDPVVISPEGLAALESTWPPFFVFVADGWVKTEGVVFGAEQIVEAVRSVS